MNATSIAAIHRPECRFGTNSMFRSASRVVAVGGFDVLCCAMMSSGGYFAV